MTVDDRASGPSIEGSKHARFGRAQLDAVWAAAIAFATAAAYIAISWRSRAPIVYADEAGFLGNARWLVGGPLWRMGGASSYGLGYPTIISPVVALFSEPDVQYRLVVAANVVMVVVLAALLFWMARTIAGSGRAAAAVAALIGAAYPSLSAQVGIAWAEVAATLAAAAFLATGWRVVTKPSWISMLAHAAITALLVAIHGRFALIPAIFAILMIVIAFRESGLRLAAVLAVMMVAAGWLLNSRAQEAVLDARWNPGVAANSTRLEEILKSLSGQLFRTAAGQVWYLVASSAGLVAIGAFALLWAFRKQGARNQSSIGLPVWVGGGYLLAAPVTTIMISVVYMGSALASNETVSRIDYAFYGRYVEAFSPSLIALGIAACFAISKGAGIRVLRWILFSSALVALVLGLTVVASVHSNPSGTVSRLTVSGVFPLVADLNGKPYAAPVLLVSVCSVSVLIALVGMSLRRGFAVALALVTIFFVFVAAQDFRARSPQIARSNSAIPGYLAIRALAPKTVAYDMDDWDTWGYFGMPFWFNESEFVEFHSKAGEWPEADLYVGPSRWPAASQHGLKVVGRDKLSGQSYWAPM